MKTPRNTIRTLAAAALLAFVTAPDLAALITVVNDDNSTFGNAVPGLGSNTHTVSFDAGATADKLIVSLSSETGGSGPPVITYNGDPLTQVPGTGNNKNKGIWYLDNPYTGGPADLVIDMTSYDVVNGIGFGVVSVSGAAPGTTGGDAAGGLEVLVTTTDPGSLIVSGYASNTGALPVVPSGDSQLYVDGAIGSASGAAAYRILNLVPAGLQTITYFQDPVSANSTSAAGFAPVVPTAAVVASDLNGITAQTGSTNTITGFTVAPGDDRKLVLAASWEQGNSAISATWNGTESFEVAVNSAGGRNSAVLYLDDPTLGTGDIVVTFGANTGSRVGVLSLTGAADGVATTSVSNGITGSLDVPVSGSLVVGVYTSNTTPAFSNPPAFTNTLYSGGSGSSTGNAGYQAEPAGLRTFTWTSTNGSGDNNALASFVPAAAAPVIVTNSPANGATDAALNSDLVATFSEPVVAGTGDIELWQVGGGSPVESFDAAVPAEVDFSGQTVTINPTSDLVLGVEYYVLIPPTAIVDTSGGDAFAGIADSTTWSFGDTAPVIAALSPADDATNVALDTNLVATFSESVVAGTGDIELWQVGGGTPVESFNAAVPAEVVFSGASFTINPTADLDPAADYYVIIPATAVVDLSAQAFAGIAGTTEWNFSAGGQTWDGGDIDDNWTSVLNWDADVAPDFSKPITFVGDVRNTPNNDRTADAVVGGINLANDGSAGNSNAFTLGGNRLTLGGDITTTASSSGITDLINLDMILDGDRTLTIGVSHNLRANNVISEDASARTLIKDGDGSLILAVDNTYTGGTEVNAGTVQLNSITAAGTGAVQLGATSGSADARINLAVTGTNPANALIVRTGSAGTKTLANASANTVTYAGNITANDDLTILGAYVGGRLTISGTNTVAAGKTVSFLNTGSGANILNQTADWSGDGSLSYASDSSPIGFNVSGTNTYSGGTTLGAMSGTGELIAQNDTVFGTGPLSIGATQMRTGGGSDITFGNTVTFVGDPTFTTRVNETSLIFTGNASLGATRTLTVEAGSTEAGKSVDFQGEISGSGFGITKGGAGTLTLSGTNTYTGDTTVNTGVLAVTGASIVDSGKLVINGTGKVDLTNTETVAALDFDGTPQPDGDYSATSVPGGATITTASFSGGGTLTVGAAPTDPYAIWSGGAPFDDDANNDGVSNGVAWLLGSPSLTDNAIGLLPKITQSGGNLVMSFTCLKLTGRGSATLNLEHSSDLGISDPWFSVAVPDTATTVSGVAFTVPTTNANSALVDLQATIPVGDASSGKLFGRLRGVNP